MSETNAPASLLTLPAELRNAIYDILYVTPSPYLPHIVKDAESPTERLSLSTFGRSSPLNQTLTSSSRKHLCGLLQSCKQLHAEAKLIYLSRTVFSLPGYYASPEYFSKIISPLSSMQVQHIRHITLTGRINNMHALNESWNGIAFDNPDLHLETLTIIPRRPQTDSAYAHIADLSQSHALAYTLSETLKKLKGVDRIIVRNDDEAFSDTVWKLVYRGSVWRLWKWAGGNVGLKFRQDPSSRNAWFEILNGIDGRPEDGWREAHEEVERLI